MGKNAQVAHAERGKEQPRRKSLPKYRLSSQKRSVLMAAIKSKDTKPELIVRTVLHRAGLRYRLHVKKLAGCPDIVLPKFRTVIFVNGCFWHGHGCNRDHTPRANRAYWHAKIQRNKERDRKGKVELRRQNWRVCTMWECSARAAANRLVQLLLRVSEGLVVDAFPVLSNHERS